MRTRTIRSALALLLVSTANAALAVSLNPKGTGQALIYPYYTVNNSQDTLISVVNTSAVGKVAEVRFLEGYNGRDTLAFTLFLSKFDVWTAAVTQASDDGGAILKTSDASCTFPRILTTGASFLSTGYDGSGTLPADSGPQTITRTREGFIEIIAGGDIVADSTTDVAITHVQNGNAGGGVPPGCADLSATSFFSDIVAPTGGLFGNATIVNVGLGTFFGYNAEALQGFTDTALFSESHADGPTLADANSSDAAPGGAIANIFNQDGRPLSLSYAIGVDAVSAALMADSIYNEYVVDPSLGASTDWVVTFPTKHFYVDGAYGDGPLQPFAESFTDGVSNVLVEATIYDREEGVVTLGPCTLCPPVDITPAFAYEVNVATFENQIVPVTAGPLGSALTSLLIPPNGTDGAAIVDLAIGDGGHSLSGGADASGSAVTLKGLPVVGFMAYNVINAQAQPGMLANYSGTYRHRSTMSCNGPAGECASVITGGGQ